MDFTEKNDEIVGLMVYFIIVYFFSFFLLLDKSHTLGLLFAEFLVWPHNKGWI